MFIVILPLDREMPLVLGPAAFRAGHSVDLTLLLEQVCGSRTAAHARGDDNNLRFAALAFLRG